MTVRGALWLALMTLAGLLSAAVTLYGVYSAIAVDFQLDASLITLYCLLPFLCFPIFMLVRPPSRSLTLLAVLALGYLAIYSMLNWRTCAELGYCGTVASTIIETLKTRTVLAYLAVVVLSFFALAVDDQSPWKSARK
jgi:hypothetical protein